MLTKIQPDYDLRFVEKVGSKVVDTPIDKFPCVIGHQGDIAPQICNGMISKRHCTVVYNIDSSCYDVIDGADGIPSTNHIYFGDGGESEQVDRATLKNPNERLYLIRLTTGTEAYLELYNPGCLVGDRSTQGLDPALVQTTRTAEEAHSIASSNKSHIDQLEGKLGIVLQVLDLLGTNPKKYIVALLVLFIAIAIGSPFAIFWVKRDAIVDALLPVLVDRLDHRKDSIKP
jgi:hypothetical protein